MEGLNSSKKNISLLKDVNQQLLNRRKFAQSAPVTKRNVTKNEKSKILDESNIVDTKTLCDKTILRKLQPKQVVSMNVDKWVSIHQRRSKSATCFINFKQVQVNDRPKKNEKNTPNNLKLNPSTFLKIGFLVFIFHLFNVLF